MKEFDLKLEHYENDWDVMAGDLDWQDFLVIDEQDALLPLTDWDY